MPATIIETSDRSFQPVEIDPITLDIIEHALRNARREMDEVVFRSAMSSLIREQHDAFPMITDVDGNMVVGQFGSPVHGFKRAYEGTVEEGDLFLTSDPYASEAAISHAPDWLVVKPVFREGRLIGWTAMFGHVTDIGGKVPGSLPVDARTIYEEGIYIPPVKIYRRGEQQTEIIDLIMNNVRNPIWNRADLRAIGAAANLAAKRIDEICDRFGVDTYMVALQGMLRRCRRAMKQLIDTQISDQKLYFEDYVDDDGRGRGPYKLCCTMEKRDGKLLFDFTGTDPQSDSSINFLSSEAMFKMFVGTYMIKLFDPQILFNDGFYDLVDVNFPKGSILNPIRPAALGCRTVTLQREFDVLIGLLGQRAPKLMTAAGYSDAPLLYYWGEAEADGREYLLIYMGFGGIPGRPAGDGHDGSSLLPAFMNLSNEFAESYYPIRIDRYESIPDSGGPGLNRGGNGILISFRFLEPGDIAIHDSRWLTYPWGVNGGLPGERSSKKLERADGSTELLAANCDNVHVEPDDVLHFITWGGGGWGDPLERDAGLVALEVDRGLVTRAGARRYGVVLDDDLAVDRAATERLRAKLARERGDPPLFDRGDSVENLIARCREETGLEPPRPPSFRGRTGLRAAAE